MEFQTLRAETDADGVLTITLDRPDALNALSQQLVAELSKALRLARQPDVRGVVITGAGEKAFAAGADIKEMADKTYMEAYRNNMFVHKLSAAMCLSMPRRWAGCRPSSGIAPSRSCSSFRRRSTRRPSAAAPAICR